MIQFIFAFIVACVLGVGIMAARRAIQTRIEYYEDYKNRKRKQ